MTPQVLWYEICSAHFLTPIDAFSGKSFQMEVPLGSYRILTQTHGETDIKHFIAFSVSASHET